MIACPVPSHPSNLCLNLYLSYSCIINVERGDVSWYILARGGWIFSVVKVRVVSQHLGVSTALTCVGTTASVSSTLHVYLMVPLVESPIRPQSYPQLPLLCGVYLLPNNFSLPLSGSMPHFGCGLISGGGLL